MRKRGLRMRFVCFDCFRFVFYWLGKRLRGKALDTADVCVFCVENECVFGNRVDLSKWLNFSLIPCSILGLILKRRFWWSSHFHFIHTVCFVLERQFAKCQDLWNIWVYRETRTLAQFCVWSLFCNAKLMLYWIFWTVFTEIMLALLLFLFDCPI